MSIAENYRKAIRSGLSGWVTQAVKDAAASPELVNRRGRNAAEEQQLVDVRTVLVDRPETFTNAIVRAALELMDQAERPQAPRAAPADGAELSLTLIAEEQIDEDIEIARIVQATDAACEAELRELAAHCAALFDKPAIPAEAVPLHPALCARALRRGCDAFGLASAACLLMLRIAGPSLVKALRQVYADQLALLVRWGVRPAQLRIRATVAPATSGPGPATSGLPTEIGTQGALAQLVQWARLQATAQPQTEAAAPSGGLQSLRLFDEPLAMGHPAAGAALDGSAAARVMGKLFEMLEHQASMSPGARDLVRRLEVPAQALSGRDAELWRTLDHPLWQLLDRIIAVGSVDDGTTAPAPDLITEPLRLAVERLEQMHAVDRGACQTVLDEADAASERAFEERGGQIGAQIEAVQSAADRADIETALREQIVRQLRQTPAPAELRQFLVGPWVLAMTGATVRHGPDSRQLAELADLVDHLIQACGESGRAPAPEKQRALLRLARDGLALSDLKSGRIEAELADLAKVLRSPAPVLEEAPPDEAQDLAEDPSQGMLAGSHGGLPTVPIDMYETSEFTDATRDREAWLDSLKPGTTCRIFLLGAWRTAQVTWVAVNHRLFVFSSDHGGRTHSMTRRVLDKLRAAGLATTLESGRLVAQAMHTLTDTMPLGD